MQSEKPTVRAQSKLKATSTTALNAVPDVYRELLSENLASLISTPERPLKRRKIGGKAPASIASSVATIQRRTEDDDDDDDEMEFEDVLDIETINSNPAKQQQTAYRDSDDETESSGSDWDSINFDNPEDDQASGNLELTLTTKNTPQRQEAAPRRKAITKEEKLIRIQIHKMHILCLLAYLERRNTWCNDLEVQKLLRPLLSKKILTFLKPKTSLSQFGQTNSLKRGLEDAATMWRESFIITERGMRRSLWAADELHLQHYHLPADADSCLDKSDFRAACKHLKGSRDLGIQLYCALLRSAGLEVRLVCSLQPLSFSGRGPSMLRSAISKSHPRMTNTDSVDVRAAATFPNDPANGISSMSPRRRLGHPMTADYNLGAIVTPASRSPKPKAREIIESPFPVFWIEVFDEAHQKWMPVDPLVTGSISRPRAFEPPASDRENSMSYVIAFEEEGTARDVTKRYAKAYNAKTRKIRIEAIPGGDRWWKRTMHAYHRGWLTDTEQIEDGELIATEAKESMPRNVIDFKDHPFYALERHIKRNEVLVGNTIVGKVVAGRDTTRQGLKKLENVYRRGDVKTVKSSGAWYRLGRDIKMGEQPTKTVNARTKSGEDDPDGELDERAGTNLYTKDQTEPCNVPPIVDGLVPKNSYGNLDIFVPSMVPEGGVHIQFDEASRAARLLGIDYADAVTGFVFRGRQGTAILKGVVVAIEYREAIEAVIDGFRDEKARAEEEIRSRVALRMWRKLLIGLRIQKRVGTYNIEGERDDPEEYTHEDDGRGMESEEYDDDGGGGFFPE